MREEVGAYIHQIQADIALIQTRIVGRQKAGFHDVERLVESLVLKMFSVLDIAELKNKNLFRSNFPAIDLAQDPPDIELADDAPEKRVAVQVTTNATTQKIKNTLKQFEKKNDSGVSLQDQYSKLYIVGFCNHTPTPVPDYCTLAGPDYFVQLILDDGLEMAKALQKEIQQHVDYSSLHPWNDIDSLSIILHTLDRSAVKHRMNQEGRISDMDKAFNEVMELITKGTINGISRAKALVQFDNKEIAFSLNELKNPISKIQAIVYSGRQGNNDFYIISEDDRAKIDKLKVKIANAATKLAKAHKINLVIKVG